VNFHLRFIIGIAGLSTAISCGRRGHSILVLESTKEVRILEQITSLESQLQSIGAGLGLTPPTKQWYECEYLVPSS
jgi:2-polyprenyl-6-methoxyphenol hydroxylase-like FAD-dependent oxidoreductase